MLNVECSFPHACWRSRSGVAPASCLVSISNFRRSMPALRSFRAKDGLNVSHLRAPISELPSPSSHLQSPNSESSIQRTAHPNSRFLHDVSINLGGRHILMPEQIL